MEGAEGGWWAAASAQHAWRRSSRARSPGVGATHTTHLQPHHLQRRNAPVDADVIHGLQPVGSDVVDLQVRRLGEHEVDVVWAGHGARDGVRDARRLLCRRHVQVARRHCGRSGQRARTRRGEAHGRQRRSPALPADARRLLVGVEATPTKQSTPESELAAANKSGACVGGACVLRGAARHEAERVRQAGKLTAGRVPAAPAARDAGQSPGYCLCAARCCTV
jgi:hypothetical protein